MRRYAAKLLFQYRMGRSTPRERRLCEERIINFSSTSARAALREAKRRGKRGEHAFKNSDGQTVRFEFVGVLDFRRLGLEVQEDEVWYEMRWRLAPTERDNLIPADDWLLRPYGS